MEAKDVLVAQVDPISFVHRIVAQDRPNKLNRCSPLLTVHVLYHAYHVGITWYALRFMLKLVSPGNQKVICAAL